MEREAAGAGSARRKRRPYLANSAPARYSTPAAAHLVHHDRPGVRLESSRHSRTVSNPPEKAMVICVDEKPIRTGNRITTTDAATLPTPMTERCPAAPPSRRNTTRAASRPSTTGRSAITTPGPTVRVRKPTIRPTIWALGTWRLIRTTRPVALSIKSCR
jgi:hypothetical protein